MPDKNSVMLTVNWLLLNLFILISVGFSDELYAQQKEEAKPYKLMSSNIDYCKTNKDEIQIRIKLKLLVNNPFQDRLLIHPLTKKGLTYTSIYKNADDLTANRRLSGEHIFRITSFRLNKPLEQMAASDLFSFFTMIGPASSYEETFDYLQTISRQEHSAFGGSYFLKLFFEAYLPEEIEDLIKERMKPFNPVILGGFSSEPILVEIKDFNSLPRCE